MVGTENMPESVTVPGEDKTVMPGLVLIDGQGGILELDKRAAAHFQGSPVDFLGKNLFDLPPFQECPHLHSTLIRALHTPGPNAPAESFTAEEGGLRIKGTPAAKGFFLMVNPIALEETVEAKLQKVDDYLESANLEVRDVKEETSHASKIEQNDERTGLLRRLLSRLILAEQTERRKLADELHDYLPQVLVGGKIKLVQAHRKYPDESCLELLFEAREAFDKALQYTRTLVANLSPTTLYDFGLKAALDRLKKQNQTLGLQVAIRQEGREEKLPDEKALLAYQSVRELLHNVVKHSEVQEAEVYLNWKPNKLVISVQDEGQGFQPKLLKSENPRDQKFGLFSIGERLESFGGQMDVRSQPGEGTTVKMTLPLGEDREISA